MITLAYLHGAFLSILGGLEKLLPLPRENKKCVFC